MNCNDLVESVTDYLDDAMASEERGRVEEHLAECDGCGAYLEQLRQTIRVTGMLTEEQISDEARSALLEVFRSVRSA